MLKIPVAFILFAVLLLVAANLWHRHSDIRASRPFLALLLLSATQALLVGLRWDFGISQIRLMQVMVAAILPVMAWLVFKSATSGRKLSDPSNLKHLLLPVLVALALLFVPDAIDLLLVFSFGIYGFLFLRLARAGDTQFRNTAFGAMFDMRRAIWLLAFTLIGSAAIDILVFVDFMRLGGSHAANLIGIGNMLWLLALGIAVSLGSSGFSEQSEVVDQSFFDVAGEGDLKVAESIHVLLSQTSFIKDPGLNLSRLARRVGLPARAVSNAINRVHGCNVSQYINGIRVKNACELLSRPGISVTEAIYASGFQTKSNFNREFLRVTGQTPRDWRKSKQP